MAKHWHDQRANIPPDASLRIINIWAHIRWNDEQFKHLDNSVQVIFY